MEYILYKYSSQEGLTQRSGVLSARGGMSSLRRDLLYVLRCSRGTSEGPSSGSRGEDSANVSELSLR